MADPCEPVTRDELVSLLAGELDPAAEAAVRDRLARDPRGPAKLERLRGVDDRVRRAFDEDAGAAAPGLAPRPEGPAGS